MSGSSAQGGGDDEGDFDYVGTIKALINNGRFADKYSNIIAFLLNLVENISAANEIIDNERPKCNNEILRQFMTNLVESNNRLIKLMGADNYQMNDDKLTEIAMNLFEDSNRTQQRNEYLSINGIVKKFEKQSKKNYLAFGLVEPLRQEETTSAIGFFKTAATYAAIG